MMRKAIAHKLLMYVLYSAVVTALPVLAATPAASLVLPALHAEDVCIDGRCHVAAQFSPTPLPPAAPQPAAQGPLSEPCGRRNWWCRGPVRRAVRGVACFVSRPWRR